VIAVIQRQQGILDHDICFKEFEGSQIHRIHGFAAKFPPQLPRYFIQALTKPGDTILDPMMGSGTVLVEAMLCERKSIGIDIDPLAILLSKVKTSLCDGCTIIRSAKQIASRASVALMEKGSISGKIDLDEYLTKYDMNTRKFFSYWFPPNVIAELSLLVDGINQSKEECVRDALKVALSSIIVTKSAGVSLARDITHSRPHKVPNKNVKPAISQFEKAAQKIARILEEERKKTEGLFYFSPLILEGDARALPVKNGSIRLIITSPPYAAAIDYMRAHKFSLLWLGYRMQYLSWLRSRYIGLESRGSTLETESETANNALERLAICDLAKAQAIAKYFNEMRLVIREMYSVLQTGGYAVLVVGPSTARGVKVLTHKALVEIGAEEGFSLVGIKERKIDRDWRQLPLSNNSNKEGIEARIHEEYVMVLGKR